MHIMFNHIRSILIYLLLLSALPAMSNTDHGDHLGSANWITDDKGYPVQYIHYAPYGELIANQRPCDYDERFKFTGKERDYESGYDAFGARYYSCVFGHWLSVDPLADKYPNISPYAYCGWNPINAIDPDGRDVWELCCRIFIREPWNIIFFDKNSIRWLTKRNRASCV